MKMIRTVYNRLPLFKSTGICGRNIASFCVNGELEEIIEREDYPIKDCKNNLFNKTIGVLGYGPQALSQSLNLKDNGFNVNIGVREGPSYSKAQRDGWEKNKNLFSIEEAVEKSDIIMYLLSDVGQIEQWDKVKYGLTEGKTLYFSHGFGIVYSDQTNIIPPENVDVVLVAPKGAGISVREKFLSEQGINASYAIYQDYTGKAEETCMSLAFGIGCGHVFKTTFQHEVYSDLVGERSVLMGLIQGAFSAQYKVLRDRGHSPSEAYNETVEEALVSLYPLINSKGMDWLYKNCSTTAQRGALDWAPKYEKAIRPVIEECYDSVINGIETENVIKQNSNIDYRKNLNHELNCMSETELWKVGRQLRKFRV